MEKFMEEVAKELTRMYNKANGTHFKEYWEVLNDQGQKRAKATVEILNKLRESNYIKEKGDE